MKGGEVSSPLASTKTPIIMATNQTIATTKRQPLAPAIPLFRVTTWDERRLVGFMGCSIRIRGQCLQGKTEEGVVELI